MNVHIGLGWTDERVETLKRLAQEGLSASQIAAELGGGISRNGVIGKAHRIKVRLEGQARKANSDNAKAGSILRRVAKKREVSAIKIERRAKGDVNSNGGLGRLIGRAREAGATSLEEVFTKGMQGADRTVSRTGEIVDDGPRIPLLSLTEHTCKWPEGDPKEVGFGFCGAPIASAPYCAKHQARAYYRAV